MESGGSPLQIMTSVDIHLLVSPVLEIRGELSTADKVLRAPSFFLVHHFHHSTSVFKATLSGQSHNSGKRVSGNLHPLWTVFEKSLLDMEAIIFI